MLVCGHSVGLLSRSDGDYARKSGKECIGDDAPVLATVTVGASSAKTKTEHRGRS
jgi:hypothetical protein